MHTENSSSTTPEVLPEQIQIKDGQATYCPEDNKLRLYVGRVPRDEYEKLRAEGWTSTPKQDCDFVATWTPERVATCLYYADLIEDEDQSPEDRAADRAERFAEYREKRLGEAIGHADKYDNGPQAFGYQNERRAERAAARHDRIAGRACDAWSKAEYWQRRTAGVISHALHNSTPAVRMGRIKELEATQRKQQANLAEYAARYKAWQEVAFNTITEKQNALAVRIAGSSCGYEEYTHPRTGKKNSLYSLLTDPVDPITGAEAALLYIESHTDPDSAEWEETRFMQWVRHYECRLAYEWQMLEAQGGRAAVVEMEVGGWLGGRQIHKVNKSNATGRVVSVHVKGPKVQGWVYKAQNVPGTDYALYQIDTERLAPGAYRPPTDEERAAFTEEKKAAKKAAPKKDPCPLINPTDEDAQKLQDIWNSKARRGAAPQEVLRLTQAQYAAHSKGTHARLGTVTLTEHATEAQQSAMRSKNFRSLICKVRKGPSTGSDWYAAGRVIVLTDKPQKPLPWAEFEKARAAAPSVEKMRPKLPQIQQELSKDWLDKADRDLLEDAVYLGWVQILSCSQFYWTDEGRAEWKAYTAAQEAQPEQVEARTQAEFALA